MFSEYWGLLRSNVTLYHANLQSSETESGRSVGDVQRFIIRLATVRRGGGKDKTRPEKREFHAHGWERNAIESLLRFWPRSRLDRLVSARVCPAQTLFLQIEPRVPPFTLYPLFLLLSRALLPPLSRFVLCVSSLPLFPSLSLFFSLTFSISGSTPLCAHMRQVPDR